MNLYKENIIKKKVLLRAKLLRKDLLTFLPGFDSRVEDLDRFIDNLADVEF